MSSRPWLSVLPRSWRLAGRWSGTGRRPGPAARASAASSGWPPARGDVRGQSRLAIPHSRVCNVTDPTRTVDSPAT